MDQESLNEQEPEEIRRQIEETRSSLSHKLESLEEEVNETMHDARESVKDAVNNVKRTFDLRYQTQSHPIPMFGAAVLAGYLLGALAARREGARVPAKSVKPYFKPSYRGETAPSKGPGMTSKASGMVDRLASHFDDEIREAKRIMIGTLLGAVRDMSRSRIPSALGPQVDSFVDSITRKLGGRPVSGRVVT